MTNVFNAECQNQIVSVESGVVPEAEILSEGIGQSQGVVILCRGKAFYIPKASGDLEQTLTDTISAIDKLASALTTVSGTLTSIGAMMTGPTTAPPPTLATDVANIASAVAQAQAAKASLETLKGALK